MGAWDLKPWDNDGAADWYADLFDETGFRAKVREALEMDIDDGHEEIRAAAAMLVFLGRTYVWPIDHLDDDIKLAIKRLKELQKYEIYAEAEGFVEEMEREITLLESRLLKGHHPPEGDEDRAWWLSLM